MEFSASFEIRHFVELDVFGVVHVEQPHLLISKKGVTMCKKATQILCVFAVVIAVLAVALPPKHVAAVIMIENFFEVMIPILVVGALVKYLFCGFHKDKAE